MNCKLLSLLFCCTLTMPTWQADVNYCKFEDLSFHCDCKSEFLECLVVSIPETHSFWRDFATVDQNSSKPFVSVRLKGFSEYPLIYFPPDLIKNLPTSVQSLVINSMVKANLKEYTFAFKSSLHEIKLSGNTIPEVKPNAFKSLPNLKKLVMISNEIRTIHPNAFNDMPRLEELNLIGNRLVFLESKIFIELKSLNRLYLDQNGIEKVDRDTFAGLETVSEVSLKRNKLTIIQTGTFADLKSLSNIDLSYNKIVEIEKEAFFGPKHLNFLDLSDNNLKNFLPSSLPTNFSSIDLKNNRIQRLSSKVFAKLTPTSTLKDNPWICDCELYNVKDSLLHVLSNALNSDVKCQNYDASVLNAQKPSTEVLLMKNFFPLVNEGKCYDLNLLREGKSLDYSDLIDSDKEPGDDPAVAQPRSSAFNPHTIAHIAIYLPITILFIIG